MKHIVLISSLFYLLNSCCDCPKIEGGGSIKEDSIEGAITETTEEPTATAEDSEAAGASTAPPEIEVERTSLKVICPNCNGEGSKLETCGYCRGSGFKNNVDCYRCNGTYSSGPIGYRNITCSVCNGNGRVNEFE